MKKRIDGLIAPFARWPLLFLLVFNMAAFYVPGKLLPMLTAPHDLSTPWDAALPVCTFFIVFYMLAYVQWGGSYIYHCSESPQLCYRIVTADFIAKAVCALCFLFFPTAIVRPEITGTGLFDWGVRFIYAVDTPVNLFPSVHCLESWMCFRMCLLGRRRLWWYRVAQLTMTLLVFASTVLIKQHFLVDIVAGVLVGELGLLISGPCGAWRLWARLAKGGDRGVG